MAPIEVVVCVHCGRAFQSKDDFRAHWIKAHKAKTISYEGKRIFEIIVNYYLVQSIKTYYLYRIKRILFEATS